MCVCANNSTECARCERSTMGDLDRLTYEVSLSRGALVHIEGIPYVYLGGGRFGTNTDISKEK